ncbi:HlyD family efflux transporter periplasmic adaptor subunit [Alcanivorax sp. 1008]|uniref:efflux RND transporter periplasmic adaptor subunit n=1 Tax=Alcanivorax sp. 1008 TaxID=2816853 RepID=UPI001D584569|nr:HlyD family efflux transporter periplasmic adaptor subunit [Alcanivorax sp. 1008]
MSVKKRNWLGRGVFWGLIALAALFAVLTTLREQPVWVDVAVVSRQPLEVTIVEEGRTRVQNRFVVSAPVAGYVRRIELEVGERVAQGQLLTRLEPLRSEVLDARSRAEAEAMVAAAQASLAAAEQQVAAVQADQQLAASELKRIAQLAEKQLVSQEVLQQTEAAAARTDAALRSSRFGVDVARHQLEAARMRVSVSAASSGAASTDLVDITAPVSGAVLQRLRQSEGVVMPGQSLLELGDPAALEVEVDVQSFDAVRIQPGTEVRLTGWGGDALMAIVRTVEPVGFTKVSALGVEEQRVHVVLDITAPAQQWALLGDGYRVDAHFILWRGDDVLVVPESALFRRGDKRYVFVVDGDMVKERMVETGNSDGFRIAVRSGLEEGEQVVRHPDNSLTNGARVRSRL